MRARFSLHPVLVLVSTALLSPATGCGGSSVDERSPTGTGGSSGVVVGSCDNPIAADESGWVSCDGSFSHRETADSCGPFVPRSGGVGNCNDADCADMLYGHCAFPPGGGFGTPATCIPGCLSDGDCNDGEICFCEYPVGRCIPATCTVDADCGPNAFCSTYVGPDRPACSFATAGAKCQKESDACVGDECNCALVNGERACVQGLGGCSGYRPP